jgi:hypothetical protein
MTTGDTGVTDNWPLLDPEQGLVSRRTRRHGRLHSNFMDKDQP